MIDKKPLIEAAWPDARYRCGCMEMSKTSAGEKLFPGSNLRQVEAKTLDF